MLITKEVTVTVEGNSASLNEKIYLYQNDKNIDILFTIVDPKFKFNENNGNILTESSASYSTIKVLKPNGEKFISDKLPIQNNKIILTITEGFIDQIEEIGQHKLQIQLWDSSNGRVTIPPIEFTVLSPIFEDDNIVSVKCSREEVE